MTASPSLALRRGYSYMLTLLLILGPMTPVAADPPWITVQGSGQLRIVDDTVDQSLPIVVTLSTVAAPDVTLAKVMVLHDGVPLSNEGGAGFAVDPTLATVGGAYLANIKLKAGGVTRQGTYEIWISAKASKPDHLDSQILKISIEHPAATVTLLAPIKIQLIGGGTEVVATPLQLELSGQVARLDHPLLGPVVFADAVAPVDGHLDLTPPLPPFSKSASFDNKWRIRGHFPLGAMEGTAHLSGDQLKDPVSIKVSFKNRRSLCWLYGAAALGLLFGFVIKTWLSSYLDLRRPRAEGLSMLEEAKRQLSLHPDETLAAALKSDLDTLETAIDKTKKDDISSAASQLKADLPKALAELMKVQTTKKNEINEWLKYIGGSRDLPSDISERVLAAQANLQTASDLVSSSVAAADKKLNDSTDQLRKGLAATVASWKRLVLGRLKALSDANALCLPIEVSQAVSADAIDIGKDLDASVKTDSLATAQSMGTLLDQVERIRVQMQVGLIEPAAEQLDRVVKILLQRLDAELTTKPEVRAAIDSALAGVNKKLAEDTIEQRLQVLAPGGPDDVQSLDKGMVAVFSAFHATKKEDQDAIAALVTQRAYLAAATKLREARSEAAREAKDVLLSAGGDAILSTQKPPESGLRSRSKAFVQPSRSVSLGSLAPFDSIQDVHVSFERNQHQLWIGEAVQTIAVGALFGLIAYAIYADQFIGTVKELIGIFFWAFSLDLTVAKVLDAAKGIK